MGHPVSRGHKIGGLALRVGGWANIPHSVKEPNCYKIQATAIMTYLRYALNTEDWRMLLKKVRPIQVS